MDTLLDVLPHCLIGWIIQRSKWKVERNGCVGRPPADNVNGRVHRDAMEPGRERGTAMERAEIPIRLQERFLRGIPRILTVSGDPVGQRENAMLIRAHELIV